jgi:hypothetical protein
MHLKRNTVRSIRSLSAICSRGLVPPCDFLGVDLREDDMIVGWWVKERKLTTNNNKGTKTKRLRYHILGSILEQNHPY